MRNGNPGDAAIATSDTIDPAQRRRWEVGVFVAIVAVIIPLLTFFAIAAYALGVWIAQMLVFGPPGPPTG